ncbi:FAD-dependent oxidoreductase [Paremcibacter congregatus]|uniref:FAD-dependent oxidoreductase n=1 Tax=Paremcibacter congregatus TaxID=2043170 RepID=A0A2G4YQ50_9PROT|nr:FAD-dependent oxidoreductase [Paremcibacter congregatus]PHZ84452.1 FAD-dependent oxidoreductase [Paremcibacter congregatus]QDE28670.1 FAD-dependent oxidoreductase [Paremcibacter congregatus]
MLNTYTWPEYPYVQSQEQRTGEIKRHPVVVIGAGLVGLTAALDCAKRGIPVVVLDDNNTVSVGSRAVCYAKRPLEIWDRLGVADRMVEKGVSWKVGKVFFREELAYEFDLLPEDHHKMPAMINLQQYYCEEYLVEELAKYPDLIDLRWKHKLLGLTQKADHTVLEVETPDGVFTMESDWMIACDGANSGVRDMVGAEFTGQFFQDRFLIADVVMQADFPTERWFWFDPTFHKNQSALLHKQADDVWRLDFQMGWDADPVEAVKPENVIPLIKAMLGEDVEFELEWVSIYQFACRRIDNFRYGRVLFAGDAAHQVSPFGARGANTGIQDIDNLTWKLKLVIDGQAPESLLDSYNEERAYAADDNLLNSTRSTDFITPKSQSSRTFRDAVLELSKEYEFARPLVNSGRLSMPTPYNHSSLNGPDEDIFTGCMAPGTNCADAPVRVKGTESWLLNQLGDNFTLLVFGTAPSLSEVRCGEVTATVMTVGNQIEDHTGVLTERYDGGEGAVYLIRPDQHVAARWRHFDETAIVAALAKASGQTKENN